MYFFYCIYQQNLLRTKRSFTSLEESKATCCLLVRNYIFLIIRKFIILSSTGGTMLQPCSIRRPSC